MPLDELRRIEIAIELDKGVSHEELARKFTTSAAELKEIENLLRKKIYLRNTKFIVRRSLKQTEA